MRQPGGGTVDGSRQQQRQGSFGGRVFGIDSSAAEAGSGEVKEGTVSKQNKSERERQNWKTD